MSTRLRVLQNGDDALLVWSADDEIPECRGFAVERELTRDGNAEKVWLRNYVGFAGEEYEPGEQRSSLEWPFQGFKWTDHEVGTGDSARYRVVPVVREGGELQPKETEASEWSPAPPNPNDAPTPYWAYFNRGYVMSQFLSRYLAREGKSLAEFKRTITDKDEHAIRWFLSGDLRVRMLDILADAERSGKEVYAALYELEDQELLIALAALGSRGHVVLANGSIQSIKGVPAVERRKEDQNKHGRKVLLDAGVDVGAHERFTSPGALAHNKFLVVADDDGKPELVWTGSTNWTSTGLCTQLNNGLLVRDQAVAEIYMEQWKRLREAKSTFPKPLTDENSKPKEIKDGTVWFTRARDTVDLEALRAEVNRAKEAILFLMFMPGSAGLLADVQRRQDEPGLFVRGVASQLPKPDDESVVDVTVVGQGKSTTRRLEVIQPEGRKHAFAYWAAEATRSQFLSNIGWAIVHSKSLVLDPFSEDATVITGSHNFSTAASAKNDENFMVVRRNRPLAEAYLVNIFGAWRHYRARVSDRLDYAGLEDGDEWMRGSLRARHKEAAFWGF
jgi:phosphatidylserine/phosphatidylglycerophosphate/cardiolipin synthase-like enzyme